MFQLQIGVDRLLLEQIWTLLLRSSHSLLLRLSIQVSHLSITSTPLNARPYHQKQSLNHSILFSLSLCLSQETRLLTVMSISAQLSCPMLLMESRLVKDSTDWIST